MGGRRLTLTLAATDKQASMKNQKTKARAAPALSSKGENSLVTIGMVAKAAGVSASTVSRVLNGTAIVNNVKKQAIDAAIAKLGFVPNPIARGLAGGRTFSIGVVTQALDSPFYGPAMRGIEDELLPAGYNALFVSGHWNAVAEARCLDVLRSRRVDGIIVLMGRLSDKALIQCAKTQPLVATGRDLKAPGLFSLNFDNFAGARLATRHLLQLGHRRIAFITGEADHPDAMQRLRGYRAALEEMGIAADPALIVPGDYREQSGLFAVEKLLQTHQRFTAIFAANDQMALGAALGLQRRSLRVPEDVSIVGFDDLPASLYAIPPLSSVHQPTYDMGRLAAAAMLQLLVGQVPDLQLPAPRLVARESSRLLRG
jgi:LacI family transcriptional regulator